MSKAKLRAKRIKQPIPWVQQMIDTLGDKKTIKYTYRYGQYKLLRKLKGLIKAGK